MKTLLVSALLAASAPAAEEGGSGVTNRNLTVGAFMDLGQVGKGVIEIPDLSKPDIQVENYFLNRDGMFMIYSGTMNKSLHMNIGVGGLIWKPYQNDAESKRIQMGLGVAEASGVYDLSENKSLKFGFFGYKYNPDAMNLGEYLLQSEAYPSRVQTAGPGGWVWLNSAEYKGMGLKFSWNPLGGALRQDFLLYSEVNEAPIYDISPSYVASFKAGAFEVGGGFSLHRWLPIKPSVTSPNTAQNTYIEIQNFPAYGALNDTVANVYQEAFAGGTLKTTEYFMSGANAIQYLDTISIPGFPSLAGLVTPLRDLRTGRDTAYAVILDPADPVGSLDTLYPSVRTQLTFKAVKTMFRASLDLGALTGMAKESGSFKLFAEAAILGVENQPYFYEKMVERIPVMFGLNIPTFGILDLFSVQAEYFKNPWPDNKAVQYNSTLPLPGLPKDNNLGVYRQRLAAGDYKADDLKWSVFLKKTLFTGLDWYFQVANDHFRLQEDRFGKPTNTPVTVDQGHWYYLMRFQWML